MKRSWPCFRHLLPLFAVYRFPFKTGTKHIGKCRSTLDIAWLIRLLISDKQCKIDGAQYLVVGVERHHVNEGAREARQTPFCNFLALLLLLLFVLTTFCPFWARFFDRLFLLWLLLQLLLQVFTCCCCCHCFLVLVLVTVLLWLAFGCWIRFGQVRLWKLCFITHCCHSLLFVIFSFFCNV